SSHFFSSYSFLDYEWVERERSLKVIFPCLSSSKTLRSYWCRTSAAVRSMFTSKQDCTDETVATRGTSSYQSLVESETEYEVADSLSLSGWHIRKWEQICDTKDKEVNSATIRVASYNVLCQSSFENNPKLHSHLDGVSPSRTWSHRWTRIVNEISALDADVLGLQEVSEAVFKEFFEKLLESLGYTIFFSERTMDEHNHGLIIAVRKERFKVESHETVDFYQQEDAVLDRGNIGQIVRVVCRKTRASLLLAHTHLLFNPLRGDTKFAQIAYLLSRVHQSRKDEEPVLLLGDFNIEPASKLFNYITSGILNGTMFSLQTGSGQITSDEAVIPHDDFLYELPRETYVHTMMDRRGEIQSDLFDLLYSLNTTHPNQFSHQLNFVSTYAPHQAPTVTSYTVHMANPDYIFYDTGNGKSCLTLNRRLAVPTEHDLSELERWPNEHIPSDHICLLAEFSLTRF
ncbi:hypothetical protein PRIPAC_95819, partial [Pristionchus pacificus]